MSFFGKSLNNEMPDESWPLRFDSFNFDVRCYNTLRCHAFFMKQQLSTHIDEPSGKAYSPDWKEHWKAGFIVSPDQVFPPPVEIHWTALDGNERSAEIDLEDIFPQRQILHEVAQDDVDELFGLHPVERIADILLEVNDSTINVYMRSWVRTKHLVDPSIPDGKRVSQRKLILAWTKTY
jgi:hypothetical protein